MRKIPEHVLEAAADAAAATFAAGDKQAYRACLVVPATLAVAAEAGFTSGWRPEGLSDAAWAEVEGFLGTCREISSADSRWRLFLVTTERRWSQVKKVAGQKYEAAPGAFRISSPLALGAPKTKDQSELKWIAKPWQESARYGLVLVPTEENRSFSRHVGKWESDYLGS